MSNWSVLSAERTLASGGAEATQRLRQFLTTVGKDTPRVPWNLLRFYLGELPRFVLGLGPAWHLYEIPVRGYQPP